MTETRDVKPHRFLVMDRWLDIVEDEPPRIADAPTLYHYTDAFGVHGIVSSNCLWATAAQFSNDMSEIDYAASVALDVIHETWQKDTKSGPWEKMLADHLERIFARPLHTFGQPFIVCFCEEGDLLSQWRAYGRSSGFSLAFSGLSKNQKVRLLCKDGFRTLIKKVIYDEESQRERLRFSIANLIKLVNGFSFSIESEQGASAHVELSLLLVLEMTDWACAVKHKAFSEEKEWRIITYPKGATLVGVRPETYEGVSVRPTSKLLLPYMTLGPPEKQLLPLVEVRCGPSQYQEQSGRALNILLNKHQYKNLPVTFSRVPLRV